MILRQYTDVQPSMRYSLSAFYDYHPNEVKRRRGTTLAQIKVLEEQFRATDKPDAATRGEVSTRLGMALREVQVWFQNRRAKEKMLRLQAPSIPEPEAYLGLYLPFSPSYSNLSHTGMQLPRDCAEAPQLMGEPTSAPAMADCSLNAPSTVRNTQNNTRWNSHEIYSRLRFLATNNYFLPPSRMDFTTTTAPHLSWVPIQRSLMQLSTVKQTHRISASSPAFTPQGRGRQIPVVRSSQLTISHIGLPRHQFTPMETRTLMPLSPGAPSSSVSAPLPPSLTRTAANDHHAVTTLLKQPVISSPWCTADAFMSIFNNPSCPDLRAPSTCSVSRAIWYYHHPFAYVFSPVSELKLMRRPIVPALHLSSSSPSMRPVHTYPDWSYLVGILNRVASSDDHVNSATLASLPLVIAIDWEDSIEYSRRIAGAAGAVSTYMAGPVESAGEEDRGKSEFWRTFISVY